MVQFQTMNRTEKVLLLGFLPLLGATGELGTAVAAAIIGFVTAMTVWGVSRLVPEHHGEIAHWSVLLAVGFSLAYLFSVVAGYVVPIPRSSSLYLYLIGATPLVYIGAAGRTAETEQPVRYRTQLLLHYAILAPVFGIVRELLGRGTLLGTVIFPHGMIPVGILSTGTGALLLFAGTAFLSRAVGGTFPRKKGVAP